MTPRADDVAAQQPQQQGPPVPTSSLDTTSTDDTAADREPDVGQHNARRSTGATVRHPWIDTSADDSDVGWGEAAGAVGDDWYERERPPHHG